MKHVPSTAGVALLLTMGLLPLQAEILYESDWATGNIYKFTSDGVRSTFASGLNAPEGLAFDGAGNLYVGNAGASQIVKITPDGTKSVFAGGFLNPFGLAFNSTGDLFVSTDNGNIYQVAPDGSVSTFASGFNQPHGIAFDSTGNLFVADAGHYQIVKVAPNGQKGAFASSLFNDPKGLVFNRLDELFMSNYGGITKYEPNGTSSPVSSAAALGLGMTFDHSGNLFVADFSSNKIFEISSDGSATTFSSDVSQPFGLAFVVPEPAVSSVAAMLGVLYFTIAKRSHGARQRQCQT